MILKGFKSCVLKVCETKGVADMFLRKCINLKGLVIFECWVGRAGGVSGGLNWGFNSQWPVLSLLSSFPK